MSGQINWHDLEIFHAVLECGSFSEAARSLGLSQPTVSRHIDGLEQKLGKELFTRGNAGLEPSELALSLAEHAGRMNDGMFAIQRTLDGKEEAPSGVVTFSMPHGLGGMLLVRALAGFLPMFQAIAALGAGIVSGMLSDRFGLPATMQLLLLCALLPAIGLLWLARKSYDADMQRKHELGSFDVEVD